MKIKFSTVLILFFGLLTSAAMIHGQKTMRPLILKTDDLAAQQKLKQISDVIRRNHCLDGRTKKLWQDVIIALKQKGPVDVDALVNHVMKAAYDDAAEDLKEKKRKIEAINNAKQIIRQHLNELRRQMPKLKETIKKNGRVHFKSVGLKNITSDSSRKAPPVLTRNNTGELRTFSKLKELDSYFTEWEEKLNTLGEDGQFASLKLQDALSNQSQVLQTLSNISKILNDTAMGMVHNIR